MDKSKKTDSSTVSPASSFSICLPIRGKSSKYYFEDGSFVIEFRDVFYNVHYSILRRQSTFFESEIYMDDSEDSQIRKTYEMETGTAGFPFLLDIYALNMSRECFELLLSILYPAEYEQRLEFTLDEWIKILEASTILGFTSIQTTAAKTLADLLSCLEKIRLGYRSSVQSLYMDGYKELCEREAFLTFEEGEELGLADVIMIGHAREKINKGSSWDEVKGVFSET